MLPLDAHRFAYRVRLTRDLPLFISAAAIE
jgi:hypothetical protein